MVFGGVAMGAAVHGGAGGYPDRGETTAPIRSRVQAGLTTVLFESLERKLACLGCAADEDASTLAAMSRTKEEAARELIARHFRSEPALRRIYWIVTAADVSDEEPIKLLEVNVNAPNEGQLEFFNFPPSEHFPYRSLVAEISPTQLERLRDGSFLLPDGWEINDAREFRRSDVGMQTTRPPD